MFKNTDKYGNPFKSIMDTIRISNFGYKSLTHLFEKSNIIDHIKRKGNRKRNIYQVNYRHLKH